MGRVGKAEISSKAAKFLELYIRDGCMNPKKNFVLAGYADGKYAAFRASKLLNNPKIKARLEKIAEIRRQETAIITDMNRDWLITKINDLRIFALQIQDLPTAARCLELHGRVIGAYGESMQLNIGDAKKEVMSKERELEKRRLATLMLRECTGLAPGEEYKPEDNETSGEPRVEPIVPSPETVEPDPLPDTAAEPEPVAEPAPRPVSSKPKPPLLLDDDLSAKAG